MDQVESKFKNSKAVTDIFGYWPSFHDAEVLSLELQRAYDDVPRATLKARIYVFEITKEVDDRGYLVLRNHTIVDMLFRAIDESRITSFNHQNVLWGLEISDITSRQLEHLHFQVHFSSSFGVEAEFKCKAIEIMAAERIALTPVEAFPRQMPPKHGEFK